MGKICKRHLSLKLPAGKSAFLWGPRGSGKSHWIAHEVMPHFEPRPYLIDFLQSDVFTEYVSRPSLLRERLEGHKGLVVIDEVQKVPQILDEVHWLIENRRAQFLLTGSSARKLKRGHANLLGGRAWRRQMLPLSYTEVEGFHLEKSFQSGMLPGLFLSSEPREDLRAYVGDYLKEEIAAEALVKNLPAFNEFLKVSAIMTAELLNYENIAREVGVSAKVIRGYLDILEDTYLGYRLTPWTKATSRRMIATEKFYLFDVGVTNFLCQRTVALGSPEVGKSFEQFIFMELKAYQAYHNPELLLHFWRTSTGLEVDFLVGSKELAIEVKCTKKVRSADLKPLVALAEETPVKRRIVVSLESQIRKTETGVEIWPWKDFLKALWSHEFFS